MRLSAGMCDLHTRERHRTIELVYMVSMDRAPFVFRINKTKPWIFLAIGKYQLRTLCEYPHIFLITHSLLSVEATVINRFTRNMFQKSNIC